MMVSIGKIGYQRRIKLSIRKIKINTSRKTINKESRKTINKETTELSPDIKMMDEENKKRVFLLLLKNLKQALVVLEVFEDDKKFNRYFHHLLFEFDDTIKQAEKLNKYRDVERWIKNEYFSASSAGWMNDKEKIRKLKLEKENLLRKYCNGKT